jgi:hypothetical protein
MTQTLTHHNKVTIFLILINLLAAPQWKVHACPLLEEK